MFYEHFYIKLLNMKKNKKISGYGVCRLTHQVHVDLMGRFRVQYLMDVSRSENRLLAVRLNVEFDYNVNQED